MLCQLLVAAELLRTPFSLVMRRIGVYAFVKPVVIAVFFVHFVDTQYMHLDAASN